MAEAKMPVTATTPTAMPAFAPVDIGAGAGSGVGVLGAASEVLLEEEAESDAAVPVGVGVLVLVVGAVVDVEDTTALLLVELGCSTPSQTP
jgi:hypothetical protein